LRRPAVAAGGQRAAAAAAVSSSSSSSGSRSRSRSRRQASQERGVRRGERERRPVRERERTSGWEISQAKRQNIGSFSSK
jgi:hypothetical protein